MAGDGTGAGSLAPTDDTSPTVDEVGAIDWFLIEAPNRTMTGALVGPLLDLVDRRLIRVLDVLVLVTRSDGDYDALTTDDLDPAVVGDIGSLAGASSGLLSADDAAQAASLMSAHSVGLIVVYENLWSLDFAVAARHAGGQLLARGNLPTQAIIAALDALDA
jgi:hypothetical protein